MKSKNDYISNFRCYYFDDTFQDIFDEFVYELSQLDLSDKSLNNIFDIFIKDTRIYFDKVSEKRFSIQDIENVIEHSVCDYDCLVEKLNIMMYPEEFEKMKLESDKKMCNKADNSCREEKKRL